MRISSRRIRLARGAGRLLPVETPRHAFAYVFGGTGKFWQRLESPRVPTEAVKWADTAPRSEADIARLILFDRGDDVTVRSGD